jgi:hypothetical protein
MIKPKIGRRDLRVVASRDDSDLDLEIKLVLIMSALLGGCTVQELTWHTDETSSRVNKVLADLEGRNKAEKFREGSRGPFYWDVTRHVREALRPRPNPSVVR